MTDIPLVGLTEDQRAQALERFTLLEPHLRKGVPLTRVAEETKLPLRTLHDWLARYRRHGLAGLVRWPRSDRGRRRLREEMHQLIEGLALRKPPPSAASVHRMVKGVAKAKEWPTPSYRTVAAIIQHLDPGLVILAHQGAKAYGEAFDLLYRREADCPNGIWQADHTPFDIWVLNERDEPARPWFTAILDDYSRAVAGWRVGFQAPSALQTSLTLRQAIWRKDDPRWHVCGIPAALYTDHGSDFTSRHLEQVAVDLKFEPVFSTIGIPRGRGRIERFFGTVNQLFLSEQPGYTPPKTPPAKATMPIRELESRLSDFLLNDYHQRVHSETGCPPQQRWEAGGFLPRMPDSLEQLDLLLLTVARARCIQRDGIHFQSLRYTEPTLAAYVGESVTIRYDPLDVAEVRVFYQDRFLCRAICQELAGHAISLKEIIQARRHRRRDLRDHLKSRKKVVDLLLEVHQPQAMPVVSEPESAPKSARLRRYVEDE